MALMDEMDGMDGTLSWSFCSREMNYGDEEVSE